MVGIVSCGACVPYYRISRDEIARAWGKGSAGGERSVANFDEDSVTMAVAAGLDCIRGVNRSDVDGLYFASTTSPYKEKQASSLIAAALNLPREVITADFTGSLRAGTTALKAASDAIKSGAAKRMVVIASDCRLGLPDSEFEKNFGDGAIALMLGESEVAVSIEGHYSHNDEFTDIWRKDSDIYVRSWEDRFISTHGYMQNIQEGVSGILKKCNLAPQNLAKIALYGPDPRNHLAAVRSLGFNPKTQVQDPLFAQVGNTGCAFALMMLVSALETAAAGDRILLANYGNGCDAYLLQVNEEIDKLRNKKWMSRSVARKGMLSNYEKYLDSRKVLSKNPPDGPPPVASVSSLWRERRSIIGFCGQKCKHCGTFHFPIHRVCTICRAKDDFEEVLLSDRKGEVFTYVIDYLAVSPVQPTIMAVIEFEGGCRVYTGVTDCDPTEMKVGMPVEPSFRRIHEARGVSNYYWKCKPIPQE